MQSDNHEPVASAAKPSPVYSIRMYPELETAVRQFHERMEHDCTIRLSRGEILRTLLEEQLVSLCLLAPDTPRRKKPALDAMIQMTRENQRSAE